LKLIELITNADKVLARNEKTGDFVWCDVVQTFVRQNQEILEVEFENPNGETEKINCTLEHPFWVKDQGWTAANKLLSSDEVFTSNNGWAKVKGTTRLSENQTVYNFEVKELHNYFVGESGLWVHNGCAVDPTDIKVIGRNNPVDDVGIAKDWPGHDVLDDPNWDIPTNDNWVNEGINNKQNFYTASPEAANMIQTEGDFIGQPTVYAREIQQLRNAGYVKVGDYYVHPDNLGTFKP
jgi:hypothetical protein